MSNVKVEVAKGEIFEIKPDKRYLIIFNQDDITQDDAARINVGSHGSLIALIRGNPKDVKIIEMAEDKDEQ